MKKLAVQVSGHLLCVEVFAFGILVGQGCGVLVRSRAGSHVWSEATGHRKVQCGWRSSLPPWDVHVCWRTPFFGV